MRLLLALLLANAAQQAAGQKAKIDTGEIFRGLMGFLGEAAKILPGTQPANIEDVCAQPWADDSAKDYEVPETCSQVPLNLIFALDSSGNLPQDKFEQITEFVAKITRHLEISDEDSRVSVVQYAASPSTAFSLKEYKDRDDVFDAIKDLEPKRGTVGNLGSALRHIRTRELRSSAGWRSTVPTIVIAITNGASGDRPATEAAALRRVRGVRTMVVGLTPTAATVDANRIVGSLVDSFTNLLSGNKGSSSTRNRGTNANVGAKKKLTVEQLIAVAGRSGAEDRMFVACSLDDLSQAKADAVMQQICNSVDESCSKSYSDLVFAIDSASDSMSEKDLELVKAFVKKVVKGQELGNDKTRVAIVQYSAKDTTLFPLSGSEGSVSRAVDRLKRLGKGPGKSGIAFNLIRTKVLSKDKVRAGKDPIVVIIAPGHYKFMNAGFVHLLSAVNKATVMAVATGPGLTDAMLDTLTKKNKKRQLRVPNAAGLNRRAANDLGNIICQEKPEVRLMGFLEKEGCVEQGIRTKVFRVKLSNDVNNNPRKCFQKCRDGARPNEVVGLESRYYCYCGTRAELSKAKKLSGGRCAYDCLPAASNPGGVKCGGSRAISVYSNPYS